MTVLVFTSLFFDHQFADHLGNILDWPLALVVTGGELLISADHGNVEQMTDPKTGQAHTAHTTNPVPFLFRGREVQGIRDGSLRDIAPTLLQLLALPRPAAMTGRPLLDLADDQRSVA